MILKIARIKNKFDNQLVVYANGQPKYILTQRDGNSFVLSDFNKNICLFTSHDATVSLTGIIPLWLVGGESKTHSYNLLDANNSTAGKFHKSVRFMKNKYVVNLGGMNLDFYARSYDMTRNVFIHKNSVQIAEVVIPLSITNGFWCYIYLLDEYSGLEQTLSLLAVHTSLINPLGGGVSQLAGARVYTSHTRDGYSKLHDSDWIVRNFNVEDVNAINNEIAENRKLADSIIRKR